MPKTRLSDTLKLNIIFLITKHQNARRLWYSVSIFNQLKIAMAVPRHKHTRSSVGQRRMHIFITPAALTACLKCGKSVRPHVICKNCGYYKGKEIINVLGKLTKKEKKAREKEIKEAEKK